MLFKLLKLPFLGNYGNRLLFTLRSRTCEEVKIPVGWGHISGKWWGPRDKRPVLGLHGLQDNCGTFDTLAPYLPGDIGFLAIDFPGHGLSSRIPPGLRYSNLDNALLIKRIMEHYRWPQVSIIAHSWGVAISYLFAAYFPELVDVLVAFDFLKHPTKHTDIDEQRRRITDFIKYDGFLYEEPPCYSYDKLNTILHESSGKSVDLNKCSYLINRNIAPSRKDRNKFYFTRDPRIKALPVNGWSQEELVKMAYRIKCPFLVIKAKGGVYFEKKQYVYEIFDVLQSNNDNFEYHVVPGTHHVHLNDPSRVGEFVHNFIYKHFNTEQVQASTDFSYRKNTQ